MIPTASKRAAHGAQMLDYARPGWHREIDVDALNLIDCLDCVLGQLYGDYDIGRAHLGLHVKSAAVAYGFDVDSPLRTYRMLTLAWIREIQARVLCDLVDAKPVVDGPGVVGSCYDESAAFPGSLVSV